MYKDLTVDNWRELLSHDDDAWDNVEREESKMIGEQVLEGNNSSDAQADHT